MGVNPDASVIKQFDRSPNRLQQLSHRGNILQLRNLLKRNFTCNGQRCGQNRQQQPSVSLAMTPLGGTQIARQPRRT